MVSLIGMLIWRVKLLAPLEPGAWGMVAKAMSRRPGFVALVLLSILVIWVLNAFDAGKAGAHKRSGGFGIFALVLVAFFVLGWQLSEIDIPKMVQKFPEATKPFGKVIWPWQAAVTRDPVLLTAAAEIQVPRGATPPAIAPEEPGQAVPGCGAELRGAIQHGREQPGHSRQPHPARPDADFCPDRKPRSGGGTLFGTNSRSARPAPT